MQQAYLKALHDEELADKHHTTLLLNCYTKLKDQKMLDEFIMTDKHLNFDLETAIKVCRHAGYAAPMCTEHYLAHTLILYPCVCSM